MKKLRNNTKRKDTEPKNKKTKIKKTKIKKTRKQHLVVVEQRENKKAVKKAVVLDQKRNPPKVVPYNPGSGPASQWMDISPLPEQTTSSSLPLLPPPPPSAISQQKGRPILWI